MFYRSRQRHADAKKKGTETGAEDSFAAETSGISLHGVLKPAPRDG